MRIGKIGRGDRMRHLDAEADEQSELQGNAEGRDIGAMEKGRDHQDVEIGKEGGEEGDDDKRQGLGPPDLGESRRTPAWPKSPECVAK